MHVVFNTLYQFVSVVLLAVGALLPIVDPLGGAPIYLAMTQGLSSEEREEIKKLRKENHELRRANEILKAASVFFATELDADRTK